MKQPRPLYIMSVLAVTMLVFACKKNNKLETSSSLNSTLSPQPVTAVPIVLACTQIPSTQYLVSVRNVDYNAIGTMSLANPVNHNVDVCSDHFRASTTAGHQYNA